jgi:isopentenyl-diphosphate delta-isomerase
MNTSLQDNPKQRLVCVDTSGRETGMTIDRKTGHATPGIKHLAIQVLVFNSRKELILHKRPHNKVGGGVLDAPTTHVLFEEKPADAALRCLKDEYGITEKIRLTILGGYSYEKDYGDGSCENEFCISAFAIYDGKISPNKAQMTKLVNIPAKKVSGELRSDPDVYSPWFKETVNTVKADRLGSKLFD